MQIRNAQQSINQIWDDSIIPKLCDYIKIPNKSPAFDPHWENHGHMDEAIGLLKDWCEKQPIKDMQVEIIKLDGRTPLLFIDIPGQANDKILLYGHYDKQPEFDGWEKGLDPWKPVIKENRLYGRGGADDGYAVFASLTSIRVLQEQDLPHSHCVILIEGCEESGSFDLPYYIDALKDKIGTPSLVICLDAESGNYDQLWCTTSLRGNLVGTLDVKVLTEGVHSGTASGIVPSSFRIIRSLLSRIEDHDTGDILIDELHKDIPLQRQQQAKIAAEVLADSVYKKYPWVNCPEKSDQSPYELLLNNTWRPALSVTGADGLPQNKVAGNVTLPELKLKLSFRLPPTTEPKSAAKKIKNILEKNPPENCQIHFNIESAMGGWNAPETAPWLEKSMQIASENYFNKPSLYMGTGGSIPFMGMLGEKFPKAQFLVTGLLGPNSNAHGPNEFLDIDTGKKLTGCVAQVILDHFINITA